MYTEKVMDHFMHPRNVGEIDNASGVGTVGNAKCGDIMRIFLDIDENQIVRDAKFKVKVTVEGDKLKVSSPSKDALQAVIAFLREQDYGQPLQFTNYR